MTPEKETILTTTATTDNPETLRARLAWVKHYEQSRDAGLTCLRWGISRPTLRKWWRRYQESGEAGLVSQSRRRHRLPEPKVQPTDTNTIVEMRRTRKLGPKGIQSELERLHQTHFSTATIWTVLARQGISASVRPRRKPKVPKRYNRPIPGDRVQIDNCKISKNLHQFLQAGTGSRRLTIVHGCVFCACTMPETLRARLPSSKRSLLPSRFPEQTAAVFPVQRIQTDRGAEFIADEFQKCLRAKKKSSAPSALALPI